jgi:hypothetical protein
MTKTKTDNRPLIIRLWEYQWERVPVLIVTIIAAISIGVIYKFSDSPLSHYLVTVAIIVLYMIQIRTADEKKDFEHDNEFRKGRPVQRGLVSLKELQQVTYAVMALQLVLYASFTDIHVFLLGLASQGYAILTRKEFFVREWLRKRFFFYNFSHYIQLVILYYAALYILQPKGISYALLIVFAIFHVFLNELGRKMYPASDASGDTYSAQLGFKGSALALSSVAIIISIMAFYIINGHAQKYIFIIIPILAMGFVLNAAYHYAVNPSKANSKNVENAANIMYIAGMLSVIMGA